MLNRGIHQSYLEGVERLTGLPGVQRVGEGMLDGEITAAGQAHVFTTTGAAFAAEPGMQEEIFGATSLVVRLESVDQFTEVIAALEGQLTATVHASPDDHPAVASLLPVLEDKVGRIIVNGWPTGVEVGHAMVHGGPYPATSDGRSTSVGTLAIERFLRPVAYQNFPAALLPPAVDVGNSLGIWRLVDGEPRRG
jgi:NADP-dependent aldehyde dehydrogenase